jgi:molybdopterin/thiamine biosynthesis adenylyltransferase/proteasome lid subunit RPN8/RPN11
MRYSITFRSHDFETLKAHLFPPSVLKERAAYLICRTSESSDETRLLVRDVIAVDVHDTLESSAADMSIKSTSFMRAMKIAQMRKSSFVFVHSHPGGLAEFSRQDDTEEKKLFATAYTRIERKGPHASLVMASPDSIKGRIWRGDGSHITLDSIRVIGATFQFFNSGETRPAELYDRQVRAFGGGVQSALSNLKIGVVGAGGTGSAVAEQLIRLGVGTLYVFDGDTLDDSNLTRVYGSGHEQVGKKKVRIVEESAKRIGLNTSVIPVDRPITFRSAAELLRNCDVAFGCTDDQWGRSILTRLALYYYIPVFDMGVRIDSEHGLVRSVQGRVTTLMPGNSCLFCRHRLNANAVASESIAATDPAAAAQLRREGYIPEVDTAAPAVISFTTAVASWAVSELLHRLTGFMTDERSSSEVLFLFDQSRVRTNSVPSEAGCFCADQSKIGRGDCDPLLDLTWPPE